VLKLSIARLPGGSLLQLAGQTVWVPLELEERVAAVLAGRPQPVTGETALIPAGTDDARLPP
jgi:hypothetical protein